MDFINTRIGKLIRIIRKVKLSMECWQYVLKYLILGCLKIISNDVKCIESIYV